MPEILALIDHAETSLTASVRCPQGRLRVDMPGGIADFIVMPHLKDFYRLYPDIYLMLGVNDRQVDLVQEGVDCVIRTGDLNSSTSCCPSSGPVSLGDLCLTGLSQEVRYPLLARRLITASGDTLFFRSDPTGGCVTLCPRDRDGLHPCPRRSGRKCHRALYQHVP